MDIDKHSQAFSMLQRGDILMVDRGFRDCVAYFENKGFEIRMPKRSAVNIRGRRND